MNDDPKEELTYAELLDIMLRTAMIKAALNSTYRIPKTHELKGNHCDMVFVDEFEIQQKNQMQEREEQ